MFDLSVQVLPSPLSSFSFAGSESDEVQFLTNCCKPATQPTHSHMYKHTVTHSHMCKHTSTCINTHPYIATHSHMNKHTSTCINTQTHIATHSHIYTHTARYSHTQPHEYTHSYTQPHITTHSHKSAHTWPSYRPAFFLTKAAAVQKSCTEITFA